LKHPQNGAAVRYLEEPPGVGSTRGEGSLEVGHPFGGLAVAAALHFDLRGGVLDLGELVGRQLDIGSADVLPQAVQLAGAGDRDDPGLLGSRLNSFTPYLFQMSRENGPGVTLEKMTTCGWAAVLGRTIAARRSAAGERRSHRDWREDRRLAAFVSWHALPCFRRTPSVF
jgi:hypothetical protein